MRIKAVILVLFPILFLGMAVPQASGITGLGFGLRGGVIPSLDDPNTEEKIENLPFIGAHLKIGTLPIIDLEVDVSYAKKSYQPKIGIKVHGVDTTVSVETDYHDLSLSASAKYNLPISLVVVKPYVGGGIGVHLMGSKLDIAKELITSGELEPDYSSTKNSFHLLAGMKFHIPMIPFDIFAEGRYIIVQTDPKTKYNSIYAGLTLNLP